MKIRLLFSLGLAGALLLGACGSGDDDDDSADSGGNEATATTAAHSDATKTGQEPTRAANTAVATAAPTESADSIFDKLIGEATKKTYQATYDVEIKADAGTMKASMTLASKAPKLATRIKFTDGELKDATMVIISDGTDTITCFDFGVGGQCTRSAGVDQALSQGLDLKKVTDAAKQGSNVKELGSKTIAGRDSRCFEATDTNGTSTFCIDKKDGILTSAEVAGITKMTATEIKSSVDDKLFEPPFPVSN